jgi:hypothetical protein
MSAFKLMGSGFANICAAINPPPKTQQPKKNYRIPFYRWNGRKGIFEASQARQTSNNVLESPMF